MWNFLHLKIISGNYLRFLGVTFRHLLAGTTRRRCSLKEADPKFDKKREKSGKLIMRKISKSFCEVDY